MTKTLLILSLITMLGTFSQAGLLERVVQYCLDNGQIPVVNQSFTLRNDGGGDYIETWNLPLEKPTEETLPSEEASTNALLTLWHKNKPTLLKAVENLYVDFLTNIWTSTCRSYGIIPTNHIITVENTSEPQNIQMLMYLRAIDFDTYDKMAGEFDRLKYAIVDAGGDMTLVIHHDL